MVVNWIKRQRFHTMWLSPGNFTVLERKKKDRPQEFKTDHFLLTTCFPFSFSSREFHFACVCAFSMNHANSSLFKLFDTKQFLHLYYGFNFRGSPHIHTHLTFLKLENTAPSLSGVDSAVSVRRSRVHPLWPSSSACWNLSCRKKTFTSALGGLVRVFITVLLVIETNWKRLGGY